MSRSEVEALFSERWLEVVDLVRAFREFEDQAMDDLEKAAGPVVREWLGERGFEMDLSSTYAEFFAFKRDWLRPDGGPMVRLAVGGLFPVGLGKVETDAPYLWVYLKMDRPERLQVAEHLRNALGQSSGWLNEKPNDRQPVGRYLREAAADRLRLAKDPTALADFTIGAFPALLALEERITAALRSVR